MVKDRDIIYEAIKKWLESILKIVYYGELINIKLMDLELI